MKTNNIEIYKEGQPWGYKLTNVVNNKFYYGIAGAEQTPDTYTTSSKNTELLSAISKGQVVRDIVLTDSSYENMNCLLYTSPSPRDVEESRMPSSA